ncbi:MAG: asparagine synthetase B [Victivallales bacterium]|nr:asparagine synthetase B [Victivallales bacterium]
MNLHLVTANGIDNGNFTVADGTIVNVNALAKELDCDSQKTEDVIMASFLRWGMDYPTHLKGCFAIAVFDMDGNRLILCRDRFGTIPLYYAEIPNGLAFGSRTDEFMDKGVVSRTANLQAVWDYLTLGVVPQPNTMIKGVHSLRPGELLEFNLESKSIAVRRWWRLESDASFVGVGYEEMTSRLREAILESLTGIEMTNARLLLSGGVDSSVLLAALSIQRKHVPTLTLGYERRHQSYDETARAKGLAEHFEADARYVTISDRDAAKHFSKFIKAMDQPSRDGFNMYFATKACHECGAKDVLTGLGGDEFFAGYPHFRRRLRAMGLSGKLCVFRPLMRLLPNRFRHNLMLPFLTKAEMLECIRAQAYDKGKRSFMNPDLFHENAKPVSWLERCRDFVNDTEDFAELLARFDIELDMEHTLLRDAFLQSAVNQITPVSPLLDEQIAVMAFSMPLDYKIRDGRAKAIFTDAFKAELPEEVRLGVKHGFEMPLLSWLGGSLLPRARTAFASPCAKMLFQKQFLLNWSERLPSLQPWDYPLWSRFILVEWMMARKITDVR